MLSLQPPGPIARPALGVCDGDDKDPVSLFAKDHRIRKSLQDAFSSVSRKGRMKVWMSKDPFQGRFKLHQKRAGGDGISLKIPIECGIDLRLSFAANAKTLLRHFASRARNEVLTSSQEALSPAPRSSSATRRSTSAFQAASTSEASSSSSRIRRNSTSHSLSSAGSCRACSRSLCASGLMAEL
jgi:hypothetical protein